MKCVTYIIVLTIFCHETYQSSNDAKTLFKNLIINHLLKHKQNNTSKIKKIDMRSVIRNITETNIIDELAQKMVENFLRKSYEIKKARRPKQSIRTRPSTMQESLEIIDIIMKKRK